MRGAAVIFFAYIGFDAVSTAAQEAKNPQRDMPIGILGSLVICTVLYILVSAIATGHRALHRAQRAGPDRRGGRRRRPRRLLPTLVKIGAIAGLTSVILVHAPGPAAHLLPMSRDGLLPAVLPQGPPPFPDAVHHLHHHRRCGRDSGCDPSGARRCQAGVDRHAARLRDRLRRRPGAENPGAQSAPALQDADRVWFVAPMGTLSAAYLMAYLDKETWIRLLVWLVIGLTIYFTYSRTHSLLAGRRDS